MVEKFDKAIVEQLKDNFKTAVKPSPFEEVHYKLSVAKSINDVMEAKKELLIEILESLPVDGMFCYFCFAVKCKDCSYGKAHGICSGNIQHKNTWWEIVKKIRDLRKYIKEEYWTGEELKEEVAKDEKRGQSLHRI